MPGTSVQTNSKLFYAPALSYKPLPTAKNFSDFFTGVGNYENEMPVTRELRNAVEWVYATTLKGAAGCKRDSETTEKKNLDLLKAYYPIDKHHKFDKFMRNWQTGGPAKKNAAQFVEQFGAIAKATADEPNENFKETYERHLATLANRFVHIVKKRYGLSDSSGLSFSNNSPEHRKQKAKELCEHVSEIKKLTEDIYNDRLNSPDHESSSKTYAQNDAHISGALCDKPSKKERLIYFLNEMPSTIDVIEVLTKEGYDALKKYYPASRGHSFARFLKLMSKPDMANPQEEEFIRQYRHAAEETSLLLDPALKKESEQALRKIATKFVDTVLLYGNGFHAPFTTGSSKENIASKICESLAKVEDRIGASNGVLLVARLLVNGLIRRDLEPEDIKNIYSRDHMVVVQENLEALRPQCSRMPRFNQIDSYLSITIDLLKTIHNPGQQGLLEPDK